MYVLYRCFPQVSSDSYAHIRHFELVPHTLLRTFVHRQLRLTQTLPEQATIATTLWESGHFGKRHYPVVGLYLSWDKQRLPREAELPCETRLLPIVVSVSFLPAIRRFRDRRIADKTELFEITDRRGIHDHRKDLFVFPCEHHRVCLARRIKRYGIA